MVDIVPVCFRRLIHTADTEQLVHKIFFFVIQVNDLYRFSLDQIENIVVSNKKPTVIRCDSIEIIYGNTLFFYSLEGTDSCCDGFFYLSGCFIPIFRTYLALYLLDFLNSIRGIYYFFSIYYPQYAFCLICIDPSFTIRTGFCPIQVFHQST